MISDKLVICMHWGTRYGPHYVNRLYSACRRHITGPFQFVCFTDSTRDLRPEIDARTLPNFDGVPERILWQTWRKMSLWRDDLPADLMGRDALFLDLDIVVVGSLDCFFTYKPGHYAVIENWTQVGRGIGNTSVFRYTIGKYAHVYANFMRDPAETIIRRYRTEQAFISGNIGPGAQVFWPREWIRSFKEELLPPWPVRFFKAPPLPKDARIVVFHGKPDPDEALEGRWDCPTWKKVYKVVRPTPWIADHWQL